MAVGGYNTLEREEKDTATDELIKITVEDSVVSAEVYALGSGPQAQASFLQTPEPGVFILAGGIQERWALVSKHVAPAVPCHLQTKNKCLLANNPSQHAMDYVQWLGCDGPCNRWLHVLCLGLSPEDYVDACKRKKWFCNMSDCK